MLQILPLLGLKHFYIYTSGFSYRDLLSVEALAKNIPESVALDLMPAIQTWGGYKIL
jgi:hypothetical protein